MNSDNYSSQQSSDADRIEDETTLGGSLSDSNFSKYDRNHRDQLIWRKQQVRDTFGQYKILPLFLGKENEIVQKVRVANSSSSSLHQERSAEDQIPNHEDRVYQKTALEKVKLLPLPAFLWRDQHHYLQEQKEQLKSKAMEDTSSFSSEGNRLKKRKRDELSEDEDVREADNIDTSQQSKKKRQRSSSSGILGWWKENSTIFNSTASLGVSSVFNFFSNLFTSKQPQSLGEKEPAAMIIDVNEEKEAEPIVSNHISTSSNDRQTKQTLQKSRKRNKFLDREEWFHYRVFHYFQHYKVMQNPFPQSISTFQLDQQNQNRKSQLKIVKPRKDGAVIDVKLSGSYEEINRKYLLGAGDLYGGDFALYKGVDSPSDAHSIATVRVHYSTKISALSLLAFCRVQNKVAKAAIIAFPSKDLKSFELENLDDDTDEIDAVSLLVFNFRNVSART